jgi:hypothetical protein
MFLKKWAAVSLDLTNININDYTITIKVESNNRR